MSGQGDENMNEEAPIDGEMVRRDSDKRVRTLSRKALENAIVEKRHETNALYKTLRETMRYAEALNEGSETKRIGTI